MPSECVHAFVSHSMRVLDRRCGFAIVVISLRVGWTNLSIQFLPLVFSPMREPSLFPPHSVSLSDKTLLSEKPQGFPIFYACLLPPWLLPPSPPFFTPFLLPFFSIMYSCVSLHFNGLEPRCHGNIGALVLFQRGNGTRAQGREPWFIDEIWWYPNHLSHNPVIKVFFFHIFTLGRKITPVRIMIH